MRYLFRQCLPVVVMLLFGITFAAHEVTAQTVGPGQVLISEFRLSGPGGFADEYIELYCNRGTDCDISGYNITAFDPSFGDFSISFPSGVSIPARGSLLVGDDAGYTLNSYGGLDLIASFGGAADFFVDNEGLQLTNPDQSVVIDSVGFIGGGGTVTYIEGTGLQRPTGARPADQYAYVRKLPLVLNGRPQDTNNNANDFVLISVTGTAHPGITAPPVLGAPGPQGLSSPGEFNATIPSMLVEPNVAQGSAPNRVRVGSGNSGTISIRRSYTNNTGETITFLSFRVIEITTLNSPTVVVGAPQAQLRLVTSPNAETFMNSQGRTVVIRGSALEFDDGTQPNQPNGGGLNSSVNVNVGAGIAPGETVDVQFLYNVVQSGNFRVFINSEAFTDADTAAPAATRATAATSSAHTTRVMGARKLVKPNRRTPAPPAKSGNVSPVKSNGVTPLRTNNAAPAQSGAKKPASMLEH